MTGPLYRRRAALLASMDEDDAQATTPSELARLRTPPASPRWPRTVAT